MRAREASAALPSPYATALGRDERGARTDEVGQHPALLVEDHRAVRNPDLEIASGGAVAVAAGALLAGGRLDVRMEVEVEQGMHLRVDHQDDAAAAAAVTAVGTAEGFVLLAMREAQPLPPLPARV